ncbi:MAG: VTT domain-containing protein [Polyangiales bacterium]
MMHRGEASGLAIYVASYVLAVSVGGPFALFNTLAGYAYGRVYGVLVALPTATLAASAAFGVGRLLGRTRAAATLRAHPRFALTERVLRADGPRIATLLRLSPVMPQNLLTFLMALTPLGAAAHARATLLGLLPVTVMQVYLGSLVRDVAALVSQGQGGSLRDPARWMPLVAGLVMSAVFVTLVIRRARAVLAGAMSEASGERVEAEVGEHRGDAHEG